MEKQEIKKEEDKKAIDTKQIDDDKRAINLHWTGYCFMIANILLIIGITIAWGLCGNVSKKVIPSMRNIGFLLSIIIPAIVSMVLVFVFYYFDSKEMYLIKQHINRKLIGKYFIAGFIYIFNILFLIIYCFFINNIINSLSASLSSKTNVVELSRNIAFGILFGVVAIISLITLGVWRFIRFKIDITLVRRRHGIDVDNQPTGPTTIDKNNANSKQKV